MSPFFSSRWVEVPDWVREYPAGGLPAGFRAAGVAAGIKPSGGTDVGLLVCDAPDATSAARFTRSGVLAAPVRGTRERARLDERTGKVFVFAAIDNLWKGASSQAVQNLNLMFDIEETVGLL